MKAASLFCQYVFHVDNSLTINDERMSNSELEGILPKDKIKAIAKIVLQDNTNESQ